MPYFFIRTVNSRFSAHDGGADYEDLEAAGRSAKLAAIEIVAAEMKAGASASSVEATVEDRNGVPVLRSVISMSCSPMLTDQGAERLLR